MTLLSVGEQPWERPWRPLRFPCKDARETASWQQRSGPPITTKSGSGSSGAADTPAVVAATEDKGGGGLLRIDFDEPGGNDDTRLHRISWQEFFQTFDKNKLAFPYDEEGDSRFSKFVER